MLGESRETEDARERRELQRRLVDFALPPSLFRFRRDIAWRLLDRLLDGPPPTPNKWNPYAARRELAYWLWRAVTGLQRARLDASAA
jgi:hypothetical protein